MSGRLIGQPTDTIRAEVMIERNDGITLSGEILLRNEIIGWSVSKERWLPRFQSLLAMVL